MNGSQRGGGGGRWKFLKGRIGIKGMGCCGGVWGLGASSNMTVREEDDDDERQVLNLQEQRMLVGQIPAENDNIIDLSCADDQQVVVPPVASGINLAMALAAERHFRAGQDWGDNGIVGSANNTTTTSNSGTGAAGAGIGTPLRVSLMRLLEEGDGLDGEEDEEEEEETEEGGAKGNRGGMGNDTMCCVCMGRRKGAAFIPCGHTFCRVCSRELWLNRGSCPLCNRSILEILDIF